MDEQVLGFDARETLHRPGTPWSDERRAFALIEPTVWKPLSIDASCWLPLIDFLEDSGMNAQTSGLSIHRPAWTGSNKGMWDDLSDLAEFCRRSGAPPEWYWLLCFTVVVDDALRAYVAEVEEIRRLIFTGTASQSRPSAHWTLLGYDVADGGHYSALMNCPSIDTDDRARLVPYRSALNGYHLFRAAEDAESFRRASYRRVPEHAPFFVFGLYRVEGAGT